MSLKKIIMVTTVKQVLVEVPQDMLTEEAIREWNDYLWPISDGLDIAKHAAEMAALHDSGGNFDGLGWLGKYNSTYPRVPDVKFKVIFEDTESDILDDFTNF